jgi:hypothetical protein
MLGYQTLAVSKVDYSTMWSSWNEGIYQTLARFWVHHNVSTMKGRTNKQTQTAASKLASCSSRSIITIVTACAAAAAGSARLSPAIQLCGRQFSSPLHACAHACCACMMNRTWVHVSRRVLLYKRRRTKHFYGPTTSVPASTFGL